MKELKENVAAVETYRTADAVNREGFPAWTPSDAVLLEQLAMTGTMGRSFYATAREQTAAALELLDRAEPEAIAKAIVRGRQEGFVRAFPILGLVKLSEKSPALFQQVFEQVIVTGNDLGDFLDLVRRMRGLGRGVKRAIHNWLDHKLTPYYAMKYRTAIADAIRLSRYRGGDPLCAFVLAAYSGVKGEDEAKLRAAEEKYPVLKARAGFLAALEADDTAAAAKLLAEYQLDTDSLAAYYDRFDREVWNSAAGTVPVMKFLKYLAKFAREGVAVDGIAAEKLTVEALRKAKVFPFRLYTAMVAMRQLELHRAREMQSQIAREETKCYEMRELLGSKQRALREADHVWRPPTVGDAMAPLPEFREQVANEPSPEELERLERRRILEAQIADLQSQIDEAQERISGMQKEMHTVDPQMRAMQKRICETLSQRLDEYATEYDWDVFNRFSWVIAPDISGSMSSRIANSALTFAELSAMFVGFFMKGLRDVRVLPWNTEVHAYDFPASEPVTTHIRAVRDMVYGGTYMEAPVRHMVDHRIGVDFAVFLTDTEEYGKGWLAAWKQYRKLFSEAQAFLLRADTYQSSPISEADAARYGIWQIFGWNDSVIEFMRHVLVCRAQKQG